MGTEALFDVVIGVGDGLLRSQLKRTLSIVDHIRTLDSHPAPESAIRSAADLEVRAGPVLVFLALDELEPATAASLDAAGLRAVLLVADPARVDLSRVPRVPSAGILDAGALTPHTVRECMRRIAIGDVPMPPSLAQRLLTACPGSDARRPPRLTAREREVLPLLVEGMSNKQIARRLAISPHGAKRLVGNILAKLDSPNRTFAVTRILREGLSTNVPAHAGGGATGRPAVALGRSGAAHDDNDRGTR
ncbi:helix-turn-helix transcriptional regulator [Glycomyces arizonensis]|uniref:helix-turn-helix transcriptional regulator n=1 Tax=Glycomyces arizonensis TaxID=256035 RepID=UPI0006864BD4|nr:LuxR C-terminal-related transcriptional regulator [Glycomyces arizonensis]